mgnify:CR=1 FL=1
MIRIRCSSGAAAELAEFAEVPFFFTYDSGPAVGDRIGRCDSDLARELGCESRVVFGGELEETGFLGLRKLQRRDELMQ